MLNSILSILLVLSSSYLISCASVPDKPVCVEINPSRGWCTNTISDKEFWIDEKNTFEGKTWWELRPYMVLMPASTWQANKAYMIKMCKKTKSCEKNISTWERKFSSVEDKIDSKKP